MTRSLMRHVRIVLLSCFLVAADLAASTVAAATDTDVGGVAANAENPNKLLNNLHEFVETNDRFDDVLENNLKSYSFNDADLCNIGKLMATPDDHSDLVNDNLTNEKAAGNQLTFTNVDGNDRPTYVTDSFVDFPDLIVDQHIADDNYANGSNPKTSTNPTKIIHRQHLTYQKQDTEEGLMTAGKSRRHDNHTHHHEGISNQRQRDLQSCVSTTSGLVRAVKQSSTTQSSSIKVCAPRIPMGSLNRRRSRRRLQSSSYNGTNVTLTDLAGGIDLSNRSITFTCLLKQRCILDGEGISRIFYGTNASISIDGFQFLNASSLNGDALGSGSALTLIGSSRVTIRDSSFVYNTAPSVGGAIMIKNSTLTLTNSRRKTQFLKNEATYGGAIFGLHATIQTNVSTSASPSSGMITFHDNSANNDGGAVFVMNSTVVCDQITLEKNDATNGGAAIFIDTNVTMNNIYVSGNEAIQTGGAFVFLRANAVINNSTLDSNNGNGTVEAITSKSSSVQVSDSTFRRSSWYVDSSTTLNLKNTCLPQGSNCVLGSSCNDCCQPYISWSTKLGYYCGPNPHNVKKCFGSDGTELKSAVANYSSGDTNIIANLTNIYGNISNWCTSSVSDWSYIFANRASFNNNISNWDTSNATTMAYMFYQASSLNQDISKWNTSKVTDMSYMFYYASYFNQDISKWNTSKVTDMSNLFSYALSFNHDISKWDTSQVTDMSLMFTWSPFNQDISKWDTSKVTVMTYIFWGATSFSQDISRWDTSRVTLMNGMFGYLHNFNANISMWNVSQVTNMDYMFFRASSFNQDITGWDVSHVTTMTFMFEFATSFNQDISSWDISKVTSISNMTYGATSFNQNLCAWKNKCLSLIYFVNVFIGTSCPNQGNPVCGTGPFCYTCP